MPIRGIGIRNSSKIQEVIPNCYQDSLNNIIILPVDGISVTHLL
ncbi:MAG: hypothetical protein EZS26_003623 [Candidatus Ordinivivax streblomastigis]|uniref:Uncharacterized protein n=1 Tax=Candidatus Ordinivivax streblomastigis TaxID=2540710 RepID=A0A5M8NTQ0_9BACT|nr:MAG: hypothetical protein EZS26_003623 [Candidatus Ordinivivax streblomastigis]